MSKGVQKRSMTYIVIWPLTTILSHLSSVDDCPGLSPVKFSAVGTTRSLQSPIEDGRLPGPPTQLAHPPSLLVTPAADIIHGALVPPLVPLAHQIRAFHHHAPVLELPVPLQSTLRAVAAYGGAIVRRGPPHTPAPRFRAPPLVLLAAAQRNVRGGWVVLVPFRSQTFIGGDRAAAAEGSPALACGAHDVTSQLGQGKCPGIPLVDLPARRATAALHPDPPRGAMGVVFGACGAVFGRVPQL